MNQTEELVLYSTPSASTSNRDRVMDRRKRRSSEGDGLDAKRPRISVYFRLESESSIASEDDTESVHSIQAKETDVARDTTDTDSDGSSIAVELEYEVASLSSDNEEFPDYTSSGTEDLNLQAAAEGAIAAVLLETSMEAWATDGETSEGSLGYDNIDLVNARRDFWTCVQCNSRKDNKFYRYCNKCFQVRKTFFPPRPRGSRKRKHPTEASTKKVKLDTLKSCLSQIKKKQALSSSSSSSDNIENIEAGPSSNNNNVDEDEKKVCDMNFENIVIPSEHLIKKNNNNNNVLESDSDLFGDSDDDSNGPTKRKRRRRLNEDETVPSKNKNVIISPTAESMSEKGIVNGIENEIEKIEKGTDNRRVADLRGTSKLGLTLDTVKHLSHSDQQSPTTDECSEMSKFETESSACLNSDSGISCRNFESSQEAANSSGGEGSVSKSELCIICNTCPKNGIFLHGGIGHMCCCYKCAMRIWKNCKRCPLCNCKVKNVVKLFTM